MTAEIVTLASRGRHYKPHPVAVRIFEEEYIKALTRFARAMAGEERDGRAPSDSEPA